MPKGVSSALQEFEVIEADDALHDFGGGHGSKGHDFAAFWVIQRVTELEQAKLPDYLFVCEYLQDVAEFDVCAFHGRARSPRTASAFL